MIYDLTPVERQRYVAAQGKTIVTACPGSGKTTSIVYKLGQLCHEVESANKHAGVLCLSFTNKAVDEIRIAYMNMHGEDIRYPHEVSTIDSFLTKNIVMPYWYLHEACKKPPMITNDEAILHNVFWHHYTKKDGKDSEACNIKEASTLAHTYSPEEIQRNGKKYYQKTTALPEKLYAYAKSVVDYRLANGYLTSSDAMNVALEIISKHTIIAETIIRRYPYIILDEAQDTSYDQFCLIAKLLNAGLQNIEFVGDINQSIYEWRFARPDILEKLTQKEGWTYIPFVHNRRSVQRIINLYSRLVPKYRRQAIVSTGIKDKNIPILVYRYNSTNSQNVIQDFEGRCKSNELSEWLILTRGRSLGKMLSGSKDSPEYWKSPIPGMILSSYQNFQLGNISKAVQQLAYVWSLLITKETDYDERKTFVKSKVEDSNESTFLVNMLFQMPDLSETFETWTSKMSAFLQDSFNLDNKPDFEVYQRKKKFDIKKMAGSKLSSYFGSDIGPDKKGRTIQTIHSSKGTSTDAVLLFLSANNSGKQISLSLFDNDKDMTEKHRLLYVACSRARQFLAFAVPMDFPERQIQKLLNGVKYEIKTPGVIEGLF